MDSPKVIVSDYHTGNSQSVGFALRSLEVDCLVTRDPTDARQASHLILPGVGAAGTTMRYLEADGWIEVLNEQVIKEKTPFLGICIGMQILFDTSEEQSSHCMSWLSGRVRSFDRSWARVPHMGWNKVRIDSDHPFVSGFPSGEFFYFVNSFYAQPGDTSIQVNTTNYGVSFPSIVARDNIMGTQFHIEESGIVGLKLLKRFTDLKLGDLS